MPILEYITLPDGGSYEIHDNRLDSMNNILYVSTQASDTPKGVTWTPEGGTAITGTLEANSDDAKKYIYLVYSPNDEQKDKYDEWVSVNTPKGSTTWIWEKLGSTDIHITGLKGAYTPAGSVSQPTFSGTAATISAVYTPAGSVSQPTFSGTPATISAKGTPAGTVSQPTFTGTQATIVVS